MFDFVVNPKKKMINVRLTPSVLNQFKIACDLRGVSMSSLLHQFIVRTIREERELDPRAFEARPAVQDLGVVDEFDPGEALDRLGAPVDVMNEWLKREGKEMPADFGITFFQGWDSFTREERIDALTDAKKVLDRTLKRKQKS